MLWVEIFGIYFGGESGSMPAVEVGGGARYWMEFWGLLRLIEEIKSPCMQGLCVWLASFIPPVHGSIPTARKINCHSHEDVATTCMVAICPTVAGKVIVHPHIPIAWG